MHTSLVIVDAKASMNPARDASIRGDKTATEAAAKTTTDERRLKRIESHRLTGIEGQARALDGIEQHTSPHPEVGANVGVNTTEHISQKFGGCPKRTYDGNSRYCFPVYGIKRRASNRL